MIQQYFRGDGEWTTVLRSQSRWFDLGLKDLWRYRDLIMLFVKRDFAAIYKQTILGPLWFLLQPLFTAFVFYMIFGKIARVPTDGIPSLLFYLSGVVAWNYFAGCLTRTSDTFTANAGIFGKVYFPRLVVPVSVVIINLMTFAIQFCLFLLLLGLFAAKGIAVHPNRWILVTPLLIVQMGMLGLGLGILISAMTTKYRDLTFVVGFGVQLWMFATPIVYPLSRVPSDWRWLYALNPMTAIIETFRFAFLGAGSANIAQVGISMAISILLLSLGIVAFSRVDKTFMDTV